MPVIIEGEQPPVDPRLNHFTVTPDPGVIEVNLHPRDTLGRTRLVTPRRCTRRRVSRVSARKSSCSMAATPAPAAAITSSSAVRRRATARSCAGPICFAAWSATGTTIRRCRICSPACSSDRRASIRALTRRATTRCTNWRSRSARFATSSHCPPWLVDRVFRNVLVDVTGNTHRAEFCIDKLYAPETSSGRRGLVELRAFEMPPHARMSLAQQLLLRALIASVWQEPYTRPLVRWGTELHDRFMLPHFVAQDFDDVIGDLQRAGYRVPLRVVRSAPRVPIPDVRRGDVARRSAGVATGARAVARDGRRAGRGRHRALCRFVGRATCRSRSRA